MKRIFKYTSLALVVLALTACGDKADKAADTKAETTTTAPAPASGEPAPAVVDTKELIAVGIDYAYPPYDFLDEQGQPTGFDVEILKAIGEKQGLKFTVMPSRWDELITHLDSGKYSVAIAGFARTDERMQKYQVSNTYGYGQDVIVTLDGGVTVKTFGELKNHKVLTLGDSPYIRQLEGVMGEGSANLIGEKSTSLVIKSLAAKKGDVAFMDKGTVQYYAQSFPNVKFNIVDSGSPELESYELVMLAGKEEAELMGKINAGLSQISADGTYATIYKKWFGVEPTQLPK